MAATISLSPIAAMIDPGSLSVTISVPGRFHGFDLARQLQQKGSLVRLITSYPNFITRRFGIDTSLMSGVFSHEILNRLSSRVPISSATLAHFRHNLGLRYDRIAAERIPARTKLFVGWSGASLESMRRAKALGARTILERGSTHLRFQDQILKSEYQKLGLHFDGIHPESFDREQQEYDEADYISIPSNFVRDTFTRYGVDPRKLLVVPYGCNPGVFRRGVKADATFRVIHCGQINIEKGAHILIRAFAELGLPGAELWLIGRLSPEIAAVLKDYSASAISVKGPFPQSSLPEYYSQGSVFCLASIQDGFGMVVSQALACGLPVIATRNSGASELLEEGKNGFVVPAGNVEALKEKLLLLYENRHLLDAMASNAGIAGVTDLSWDVYGDKIAASYRRVLDASPNGESGRAQG